MTLADADLVASAALVAVTVKLPVADPARYAPVDEIVPPVALQLTAVLVDPVTAAVKSCIPPEVRVALVGAMLIETDGAGTVTTTLADADFVLSAVLAAVTEKVPAVDPAVYSPLEEIAPPVAVHETALLATPLIIAVN
jgi:hypothetical protein